MTGELPQMVKYSGNGVDHSSFIKIYDAAEKVHAMLGEALPKLRELAEED
jgi:hypothetical protein